MTAAATPVRIPSPWRRSLRRLRVALAHEVRLAARHGILPAAAVTTAAWAVLLRYVPEAARPVAAELVVFTQLALVGYTFAGALVLMEKAERTAIALAVTPLRTRERIAARVVALTALALLATAVVLAVGRLAPAAPLRFAMGVTAVSAVGLLASLCAVAPHASMAQWALPSVGPLLVIALPLVGYLGVDHVLLWTLPTRGALALLRGEGGWGTLIAALLASGVWIGALGHLAVRRHDRWVATADG